MRISALVAALTWCAVMSACSSTPTPAPAHIDPRDPEVWRPRTPASYPLPR